ncbi:MAG: UvrB/UvrC motif-containing protein, partial [Planctomycetota bacterium]
AFAGIRLRERVGTLDTEQCQALRDEAAQYYHRYVALLGVEEYLSVIRDTTRNLRVLDLCRARADAEDDREALEPIRPYITMIRTRATVGWLLGRGEQKAAVWTIENALDELREILESRDEPNAFESSTEVQMLRSMREALLPQLPVSQKAELRERLKEALERENYELAAILRDELRLMGDESGPKRGSA